MSARPLSADIVGTDLPVQHHSWTAKDTMLYALGVGCRPPEDLPFIFEGRGPQVLPTFAVIPGMLASAGLLAEVDIDPAAILHGEQTVTVERPIPVEADTEIRGRIAHVWDKGKAAVIVVEGEVHDHKGLLATTQATVFVRGAGGFGGDRGPSSDQPEVPDRDPDHSVVTAVRAEQAALYRLSGDPNPLHIDPDIAQMAGFDTPFLHGLCTFGIVGRAVLSCICDDDVSRFRSLSGRFADQVYPGDEVTTRIWRTDESRAAIEAVTQRGAVVLNRADATWV